MDLKQNVFTTLLVGEFKMEISFEEIHLIGGPAPLLKLFAMFLVVLIVFWHLNK